MKLQNISNIRNLIYLFIRNDDMSQEIKVIKDFLPYYYEPDPKGTFVGYDETKLRRLFCTEPSQIKERRSSESFEADILFVKRFILDRIPEYTNSPTVKCFFDIEVAATKDEFPNPHEAKYPITTIRAWDNKTKTMHRFFINTLGNEYNVIEGFVNYLADLKPDLLVAWNINEFDYPYLCNRWENFSEAISPIGKSRYGDGKYWYPAGISIIDLLALYNKFTLNKKASYALMEVGHDELGYDIDEDIDFTNLEVTDAKCELDVEKMVKLDEKHRLIETFDAIRRFTTCLWEDLPPKRVGVSFQSNNSKPIDMLFLREAKAHNFVLPSKRSDIEKEEYDGAYREVYARGVFKSDEENKVYKLDLNSAYPVMLKDFCLDPTNLVTEPGENTIEISITGRDGVVKKPYYFKQDSNTIIPIVAEKLLRLKDELKAKLKNTAEDSVEHKLLEIAYNSFKSLVNSLYGVLANRFFRVYNVAVAETDTFLVRDCLLFVKEKVEALGYKIIYADTDSIFCIGKENPVELMNGFIQEWAITKYNNHKLTLKFDCEGHFEKIFILALCRYIGYLRSKKGLKKEIKGVQVKRKDSTQWIKKFQEEMVDYLFDNPKADVIVNYVEKKITEFKKQELFDIAFPCKISKPIQDYKKDEIYLRALRNTQAAVKDYNKKIGEKYFWVYVDHEAPEDVFAIDPKLDLKNKLDIDWVKMYERNIFNIIDPIFDGMGWGVEFMDLAEKYEQKIDAERRREIIGQYSERSDYEDLRKRYKVKDKKVRKPKEEAMVDQCNISEDKGECS